MLFRGRFLGALAVLFSTLSACERATPPKTRLEPSYLDHDTNEGCSLSKNGSLIAFNPMGRPRNQFAILSLLGAGDRIFQVENPAAEIGQVALAPDGTTAALTVRNYSRWWYDLWIVNLEAGSARRLEHPSGSYFGPITFAPDGASLVYFRSYDFGAPADARRSMTDGATSTSTLNRVDLKTGIEVRLFEHAVFAPMSIGVSQSGEIGFSAQGFAEIKQTDDGGEYIPLNVEPHANLGQYAGYVLRESLATSVAEVPGITLGIEPIKALAIESGDQRLSGMSHAGEYLIWRTPQTDWISGHYRQTAPGRAYRLTRTNTRASLEQLDSSITRPCISGNGTVAASVAFSDPDGNPLEGGEKVVWEDQSVVNVTETRNRLQKAALVRLSISID